jgi:choline dehydrogenase
VRLRTADINDKPIINYRLLDSDEDVRTLMESCRVAREIYSSAPMRDSVIGEAAPGPDIRTDSEWMDYIRRRAVNMCHPVGSCRMGSDEASVVDQRLKLRGMDGLRIADASIMPRITSGNTNAPAIMIGERVAEFIAQDRQTN